MVIVWSACGHYASPAEVESDALDAGGLSTGAEEQHVAGPHSACR
jgi:hypothetical protein